MTKVPMPSVMCRKWDAATAEVLESLNDSLEYMEMFSRDLNRKQKAVYEEYAKIANKFAHDLLLAGLDPEEVDRRLNIGPTDLQYSIRYPMPKHISG